MQKLFLFLGVIVSLSCAAPQDSNYTKLDTKEYIKAYNKHKENHILIDVRTEGEFAKGTIEDAININFYADNFEEQISRLDTSKTAFIFCQSGGRSKQSSKTFFKAGFKKVIDLKGGYSHYK